MKTIRFSTLAIAALSVAMFAASASAQRGPVNGVKDNAAVVALSADEQWALNEALQDEYKARATYARVIETFGDVRPFSNIIHAESQHIAALVGLYNRYGLPVPEDTWYDKVPVFSSLEEACAAAVQAEVDNAALYDNIAVKVRNPDLIRVFAALQDASINRHLPAFERYLERGNGRGQNGQGQGMGYGRGQGGQGRGMGYGRGQGGQGQGMGNGRGQGQGMGYGRGQGGQGRGMGYGRGQGGQGRGMGYGRGQGGQGRGMGYGQGQGGQGHGMGNGRGQCDPNGAACR